MSESLKPPTDPDADLKRFGVTPWTKDYIRENPRKKEGNRLNLLEQIIQAIFFPAVEEPKPPK